MNEDKNSRGLMRYLTPLGAFALALGCSVGWGSFVMPGNTFLPIAGPVGTAVGMIVGGLLMVILAYNYYALMNEYPDSGGTFTYANRVLSYDHGFLCAWFLVLTYTAVLWANATALPLISRNLLGGAFRWGIHYTLAGFDIYGGELVLSISAIIIAGLICMRNKAAEALQIIMALVLLGGIIISFIAISGSFGLNLASPPEFAEEHPFGGGVLNIIALAPWAFVGFESISHSAAEFGFSTRKSFRIMIAALIAGIAAYALLALIAGMVQPEGYANWYEYISDLGSQEGVAGLPTFFAAQSAMGRAGTFILGIAALGGIVTGLIGNYIASSRLIYRMAQEKMLPGWMGRLNSSGSPRGAITAVMIVSIIIPFFGRTATSWIVDVTTIGASIAYAYTSACALKVAQHKKNSTLTATGFFGLIISIFFLIYFLVPNMLAVSTLSTESYLILAAWGLLGFAYFNRVFREDDSRRFGHSTVIWAVLLALIMYPGKSL